tara:strand:- start:1089 stop:1526 length:438 start_codon:yes stop_codon:yes gene_type:complete
MTKKTKNKYNHYTEDFRREAVRRSELPGASAVEVARELGIHPGQIYNWRRQYKRLSDKQFNTVNGVDYSKEESDEIRKLKRQISDLKEENEFLKKATVDSTGQCNIMHTGNYRGFQNAAASIKDQRADPSAEAGAMGSMEERPVA